MLIFALVRCSSDKTKLFETKSYHCDINDKELNINFSFDANIVFPTKNIDAKTHKILLKTIIATTLSSEFADFPIKKALKIYADSSFIEYKKVYEEIYENNPIETTDTFNFITNIKGDVLYCDSSILSYQRILYTYSGGAHGMTTKTNYVFDIKTGKELTEEDIFGKGFERKVGKLLTEKANILREEGKLPAENEFYNNWNIVPNGNFALTDSSVIYTFNPYEIAPYCYGAIDIEIKKSTVNRQ